MAEIPATRYVKSDDVYIAYQVLGEGPFDLLFVPGFVSNVEATWHWPELSAFFRRLASFCRLILFDKRGTGMSGRGSQNFTLEQRMHDVQAILDAVGATRFGAADPSALARRRKAHDGHIDVDQPNRRWPVSREGMLVATARKVTGRHGFGGEAPAPLLL